MLSEETQGHCSEAQVKDSNLERTAEQTNYSPHPEAALIALGESTPFLTVHNKAVHPPHQSTKD